MFNGNSFCLGLSVMRSVLLKRKYSHLNQTSDDDERDHFRSLLDAWNRRYLRNWEGKRIAEVIRDWFLERYVDETEKKLQPSPQMAEEDYSDPPLKKDNDYLSIKIISELFLNSVA